MKKERKEALYVLICVITSVIITFYILGVGGVISVILYIVELIIFFVSIPLLFMKKNAKKKNNKKEV